MRASSKSTNCNKVLTIWMNQKAVGNCKKVSECSSETFTLSACTQHERERQAVVLQPLTWSGVHVNILQCDRFVDISCFVHDLSGICWAVRPCSVSIFQSVIGYEFA